VAGGLQTWQRLLHVLVEALNCCCSEVSKSAANKFAADFFFCVPSMDGDLGVKSPGELVVATQVNRKAATVRGPLKEAASETVS